MSASSSSCSQVGVHGHAESETEVKATSSSHTLSHTSPSSSSPTTSTCYDVSVADMMRPIGLPTPQEHLRCVLMAIAMAARGVAEHVLRQLPTRGCGGGNDAIRTSSGKDGRLSTTRHLFASDGPRLPAPRACHSPTRAGTDEAGANTTTSTAVGGATNTSSSTSGGKVLAEEEEKGEEEMREVGGVFVSKASLPSPAVATIGTTTAVKEQTNHVLPFHRDSLQGYLSYQVRTAAGVRSPTRTCCEEGRRGARSPQQRRTLSTPTNMMAMQVELEEGVCATSAGVDSSSSSKHSRSTLGGTNPQSTTTTNASPESLLSSGEENARPMAKNELFHHHNHPEVEEEAPPPMLGGGTERSRSSTSDTIGPDDPREPTVVFDASKVLPLRDGNGCMDDDDGYDDVDEVEVDVDGHEDDDEEEMLDGSTGNASMRANFSENTRLSRTSVNAHRRMTIAQLLHLLEDRRSRQWQLTRELYGAEGGGNGLGEVGASAADAGASGAGAGGSSGGSAGMSTTKESGEVSAVRHPRNGATGYGLVHSDVTAEVLQQRREASRAQRRQQKEAQHAMTQGSGPSREDVPDFPRLLESRRSAAAHLAPQTSSKEHTQWTSTKVRQRRADGGGGGGLRSANTSTTSSARATTTSAAAGALMHQGQSDVSLTSSASQPARPHPSHDRRVDDLTVKHHQEGGRGSQPTYSISLIYHSSTGSTRTIDTSALPPLKGEVSGGSFRRSATGTGGAGASTTSNVYGSGRLRTATTSSAGTSARNTGTIITAGANYAMGVSPPASLHARSLSKTSTNASADERRGVSPSPAAVSGGGGGVEQHTTSRRSLPPSPALHAQQHTASGVAPLCPELLPCTSSQLVDGSPTPTAHGTTPAEGLQPAKRVREEVDGAAAEDGTMPSMSRTPPNANSRGRTGTSQRRLASTATNNVGASCASPAAAVAAPRPLFGAPLPPTEPIHGPRLEGVAGRNGEKIIGAFLGGGACGKVYECLNIETGQVLAAKQIVFDPKEPKLRQRLKQLELEMEVLTLATKHQVRWIVGFFGAERRGHAVLMYLEYCEHGSLLDYMANVQHAAGGGGGGNATAMTGDADQRQSCSGYVAGATSFPLGSNSSSDSAGRFSGLPATFSISAGAAASGTSVDGNGAMCEVSVTDDVPGVPRTVPSLELEAVQRFTYQILCGLDFLHRHNYAHLDVKTANVLLTADEACRLADFGCSMRLQQPPATTTRRDDEEAARGGGEMEGEAAAAAQASGEQHAAPYPVLVDRAGITELRGTALYMAPEMIRFERHRIGTPADVWSLGCVVMEMATGCAPWRHIASDKLRVLFRIGAARHDPILPPLLKQRALEARQWLVEHGFLIIDDDDDGTTMHMLAEEEVDEEVLDGDDDVQRTRRVMEGWLHLESFVQACVHLNPEDRASTEELLQHPFVLPVAAMEMVGEEVEE